MSSGVVCPTRTHAHTRTYRAEPAVDVVPAARQITPRATLNSAQPVSTDAYAAPASAPSLATSSACPADGAQATASSQSPQRAQAFRATAPQAQARMHTSIQVARWANAGTYLEGIERAAWRCGVDVDIKKLGGGLLMRTYDVTAHGSNSAIRRFSSWWRQRQANP